MPIKGEPLRESLGNWIVCLVFSFLLFWHHSAFAHLLEGSVFRVSRDGTSIGRLSAVEGTFAPVWAPDGRSVLYIAHTEEKSEFHLVSASGGELMRIPAPSFVSLLAGVSWLPDGTGFAFAGNSSESGEYDIYLMKLGAGEPETRRVAKDGILPAFSPNGKHLPFITNRDGNLELYFADSDGGNLRNLSRHAGRDVRPSWSPHGDRIAFESDRFGNPEICIVEIASGEVINVTRNPARDGQPAWSPDGREIAFVSDRDGEASIYRMAADGSDVARLTSGSNDREPAWSPDGQSICFVSTRSEPFLDSLSRWLGDWLDW